MKRSHQPSRGILICIASLSFVGCTPPRAIPAPNSVATTATSTAPPPAPSKWTVACSTDQVTTAVRCAARTFGAPITSSGAATGPENIPFHVYFIDKQGPFMMVGFHNFPGRDPIVRIDNGQPHRVGMTKPATAAVDELRRGHRAIARYDVWPRGGGDISVDLDGAADAIARLYEIRPQ